jgi:TonB family protein
MMVALDAVLRSSALLLAGLAAVSLLGRRSAALRHRVLALALFGAAVVVPLGYAMPSWSVPLPQASTARPTSGDAAAAPVAEPGAVQGAAQGAVQGVVWGVERLRPGTSLLPAALGGIWLAGFLAGAATLLAGLGRLWWIAAGAVRLDAGVWPELTRDIAAQYGIVRRVEILCSTTSDLIATWGLFRPRLLVPAYAARWPADRVRLVLRHELAHITRRDRMCQLCADGLRTLYWFNPLFWIACRRLRRESEQACDDAVLAAGAPARDYAAQLLEIATESRRPGPRWAPAVPMARPSTLERRVAAMLNPRLDRRVPSRRALAVTFVMLLGITLSLASFSAAQNGRRALIGAIYDPTGAVLPGVELTLEDAQAFAWQATTDAAGRFEFPPVEPGVYKLEARLPGFKQFRHEFPLTNTADWDRAITLQVGQVRESVVVSAPRRSPPAPGTAPAAGPVPVRVGGNIRAPRKLHDVHPVFPASMREAGREGVVPIEALIGRDGLVHSARVVSAHVHPDFAEAALEAVRQWRFSPTLLNGAPVEVVMTVSVAFSLSDTP